MINLLPNDYKKSIQKELKVRTVSSWLILVSIFFLLFSIVSFPAFFLQKTKKDLMTKQNTEVLSDTENGASPEAFLSKIGEINTSVNDTLSKLSASGVSLDMFKVALSPDTSDIKLRQIYLGKIEEDTLLQIVGVSNTREALLSYSTALKTNGLCEDFSAPVSSLTKSENIEFNIDCKIKKAE